MTDSPTPIPATAEPLTFADKLLKLYERFAYVQKTGKNTHFSYKFMQESVLKAKLNEALRELRLLITDTKIRTVGECNGKACVVIFEMTIGDADSGECVHLEGIGGGMDSGDKAPMKAVVSAMKYALANGLAIQTGDDPEGDASTDEAVMADLQARVEAAADWGALQLLKPLLVEHRKADGYAALRDAYKARAKALQPA